MESDTKTFIGVGIGLTAIVGLSWYAYDQGKKVNTQVRLPWDVDPSGNTTNQPSDMRNIQIIAEGIYNDCIGNNIFGNHDEDIYTFALSLSNTDFAQLYNVFNAKYQRELSQTLTDFIRDEYSVIYSAWESVKESMLARLASLNLP